MPGPTPDELRDVLDEPTVRAQTSATIDCPAV